MKLLHPVLKRHQARLDADGRKMHCPACEVGWTGSHLTCWYCGGPGCRTAVPVPDGCAHCGAAIRDERDAMPWRGGLVHTRCLRGAR